MTIDDPAITRFRAPLLLPLTEEVCALLLGSSDEPDVNNDFGLYEGDAGELEPPG